MHTETSIVIGGSRSDIFALAATIEDWPRILPHYRAVMLEERAEQADGTIHNVAVMKAWRPLPIGKIPVGWKTILDSNAETELLHFVHIGGFTRGMDVYWRLTAEGNATRVTISHDFTLTWPVIGNLVAHRIVGQFFVDGIARRTLAQIKTMVEEGILTHGAPQPSLVRSHRQKASIKEDSSGDSSEREGEHEKEDVVGVARG